MLAITILSILCLLEFIVILSQFNVLKNLKNKVEELNNKVEEFDEVIPGDKVTFKKSLTYKDTEHFTVFYTANVTEVSTDMVKVDPYEISSETSYPPLLTKEPNFKQIIINIMKDKWVGKGEISILLNKDDIRNRKLNKLLS